MVVAVEAFQFAWVSSAVAVADSDNQSVAVAYNQFVEFVDILHHLVDYSIDYHTSWTGDQMKWIRTKGREDQDAVLIPTRFRLAGLRL